MSATKICCSPALISDYEPIGKIVSISSADVTELPLYVVGPEDAKKAVVVFYDVLGFHNNTKQFCDILAKIGGYKVVMPDFFRGDPWTLEKGFGDMPKLMAWIREAGSFEIVEPQLGLVRDDLKKQGFVQAGLVGFCWGGKMSVLAAAVDSFYGGASIIHPSMIEDKDAEAAKAPILAIPTKHEPDMTEFMNILYKKPFGDKCQHHRFDDMNHGFCASHGDFSDEAIRKRATEAIQLTINFFKEVLAF